jgi:hypothetical protein
LGIWRKIRSHIWLSILIIGWRVGRDFGIDDLGSIRGFQTVKLLESLIGGDWIIIAVRRAIMEHILILCEVIFVGFGVAVLIADRSAAAEERGGEKHEKKRNRVETAKLKPFMRFHFSTSLNQDPAIGQVPAANRRR